MEMSCRRVTVRIHSDIDRQVARYRASAHACNRCSLKAECTDSDRGREIESRHNSWLTSEICRFQRGISLVLLGLAGLVLLLEVARNGLLIAMVPLTAVLVPVGLLGMRIVRELRSA
jgi:hypothetical protein